MKISTSKRTYIGKFFLVGLVCALVIGCSLRYMYASTDMYFMISTGRELLENSFEKTNPFVIDEGLRFVVQQWAYCILIAFFDGLGIIGMLIFEFLNVGVLIASACLFLSLFDIPGYLRFIISAFIYCGMAWFIGALRPEMITLAFLLIECYALEKFRLTGKSVWLWLLPFTMLLESNLHSSAVWFHFAIILAYFVPSVFKHIQDTSLFKKWKDIGLASVAMALCMFINPYGADAVFYMINSLLGGITNSNFYHIGELQSGLTVGTSIMYILIVSLALIILYILHKINSVVFYFSVGFVFCTILSMRNFIYFYLVFLYMLAPLLTEKKEEILDILANVFSDYSFIISTAVGMCMIIIMSVIMNQNIFQNFPENNYPMTDLVNVADYIKDNKDQYAESVFGPPEYCSILEYCGIKNLLFDSRPELYAKAVNGKKDIIKEIDDLTDVSRTVDKLLIEDEIQQNIQIWIDKYQFTYVIIPKESDMYLTSLYWNNFWTFCTQSGDYTEVVQNDSVFLFKRIQTNE